MVDDESAVLPAPTAFDPDESVDSPPVGEFDTLSISRPSRPFRDNGWIDDDHYFEADVPDEHHDPNEWKEVYKDPAACQFL